MMRWLADGRGAVPLGPARPGHGDTTETGRADAAASGSGGSVGSSPGWAVGDPAPAPPPLVPESEVVAGWIDGPPLVSITCPTYQHAAFVEDAIRGFLGQRTRFPFEVIIRDDASTDGTPDIIMDFAARYPSVIRPILDRVNSRRPEAPTRGGLRDTARGEFIAFCDGDDYWVDPRKLELQVDQLRSRTDAVVSHHQAIGVRDGVIISLAELRPSLAKDHSAHDLRRSAGMITGTQVYRNVRILEHPNKRRFQNKDMYLRSQLGKYGGAAFHPGVVASVYRKHAGGMATPLNEVETRAETMRTFYWLGHHAIEESDLAVAEHFLVDASEIIARMGWKAGIDVYREMARRGRRLRFRRRVRRVRQIIGGAARHLAVGGRSRRNLIRDDA